MFVENLHKSIGKCFFATFCFCLNKNILSLLTRSLCTSQIQVHVFIVIYIIYYYYTIVLHVRCKFRGTFYNNLDKVHMYVKFYNAELDLSENILDVYNR